MLFFKEIKILFFNLPYALQWTIISIIKSLAASGLMSFLSIYATAFFAIRHGFRVPVEGVPYLNFTISLISFFTMIVIMFLFILIIMMLESIKNHAAMEIITSIEKDTILYKK